MVEKFYLNLRSRPFKAIKKGLKNVEIRANKKKFYGNSVNLMSPGDIIVFVEENTKEELTCIIEKITLYKDVRDLLVTEGTENVLSSTTNIDEGIKSVESIGNYKEYIRKNGVFAIKLKKLN